MISIKDKIIINAELSEEFSEWTDVLKHVRHTDIIEEVMSRWWVSDNQLLVAKQDIACLRSACLSLRNQLHSIERAHIDLIVDACNIISDRLKVRTITDIWNASIRTCIKCNSLKEVNCVMEVLGAQGVIVENYTWAVKCEGKVWIPLVQPSCIPSDHMWNHKAVLDIISAESFLQGPQAVVAE